MTFDRCRWVIGGTDHPIPTFDRVPQPVPDGVDVRHAADGETLGAMLESGEIDALISVDVPRSLLNGSTKIARLFPDYENVERDYYRRTGIFPPSGGTHWVGARLGPRNVVGQGVWRGGRRFLLLKRRPVCSGVTSWRRGRRPCR
ncbi:hypothetical protein [Spongiactinospora gelatinilytica]|uniref:hypothetical protein n=1 Tax=Spongiactinospora gelatinilytica TaxID=2666298 RepID=UPI0018F36817|nr:hypothetical protein [Spongiactinospora gelatinilytica]